MDLPIWNYWMWDDNGEYIHKYDYGMADHPDADFLWGTEWDQHWPRRLFWTPEEAAALSFGRSPNRVAWNDEPFGVKDMDGSSEFATHFSDLRQAILEAQKKGVLPTSIPALMYVHWAEANKIPFPPTLAEEIEVFHKSITEGAEQYTKLQDIIRDQRDEIERLKAEKVDGKIHPRTGNNMLRIILAVATEKYGYPKPGSANRISDTLLHNGFSLDEETILKYLKQATDLEG